MELCIHFTALPDGMGLEDMKRDLDQVLAEDGWLTDSGVGAEGGFVELELEDERSNPKYGILAVRNYLQKAQFRPDTTIELAGVAAPIYG